MERGDPRCDPKEAVDGTAVEPVVEFVYLGSNITRDGDATKEVRRRIRMAGAVCATLHWQSMGFQHSAVEAEVGLVPVAGGVCAAVQCRVLAHA